MIDPEPDHLVNAVSLRRTQDEPIYSTLAADEDLVEIVRLFVDELAARVDTFNRQLRAAEWQELARTAHQLRGAAGSHGFPSIGLAAARVESAVQEFRPEEEIRDAVSSLEKLCRRARAGASSLYTSTSALPG